MSDFRQRRSLTSFAALAVGCLLVLAACSASSGRETASANGGGPDDGSVPTTVATTEATTEATTSSTTTSSTTTTAPPTTTTTAPADPTQATETGNLSSGSKGVRTKAIQEALKAQAYDPGEPDGKFGLKTTQAVWAFQALHGLPTDGVVGPQTEAAILAKSPQQMLRPNLGPTHTEVDLTRQVLIVWRDGKPTLITHVSSGSGVPYCENTKVGRNCGDAVTPTGVYKFYRQVEGIREAPLGKLYDPVYFHGGFAVHGSPSVPNHPASHGCVRIPMFISDYFQTKVNLGETIEVFRS